MSVHGAFVLPYIKINSKLYFLLGLEKLGKNAKHYNLIGGSVERETIVQAANRECREEAKFHPRITNKTKFIDVPRGTGFSRIYYIHFSEDISSLCEIIYTQPSHIPLRLREIQDLELFSENDLINTKLLVTDLARSAIKKISKKIK